MYTIKNHIDINLDYININKPEKLSNSEFYSNINYENKLIFIKTNKINIVNSESIDNDDYIKVHMIQMI